MLQITTLGELADALRELHRAEIKVVHVHSAIMSAPYDANYIELDDAKEAAEARVAELRAQTVVIAGPAA